MEEKQKEKEPESIKEQYAWGFFVPVFWCSLFAYPLRYTLSHTFWDKPIPKQYVMNPTSETCLIFLLLIAWYSDLKFLAKISSTEYIKNDFYRIGLGIVWIFAMVLTVTVIVLLCWLLFDNEGYHLAWG